MNHHLRFQRSPGGSQEIERRGKQAFSFALEQQLLCLNDGTPMFLRKTTYSSFLNQKFVSQCLSEKVQWFAGYETHESDHIPIYLKIRNLAKSQN